MFENESEFRKWAFPDDLSPFYDPIELTDCKVGFSIKRNYPENIRFKPAKTKDGKPDTIATIWIVYDHGRAQKESRVPVTFRISAMSLYRSKNFDYDFNDPEAPTQSSLEESNSSPQPIDIEFTDEYHFDHNHNKFIDKKGKFVSSKEILNKVFETHCDTVHSFRGLKIRTKLRYQSKLVFLLDIVIQTLESLLKKLFGRTFENSDSSSAYYHGYKYSDFKRLNEDSLNIFGYKAAKSVILLFCGIIILFELFSYNSGLTIEYFDHVMKSNFLSLTHSLLLIWILDAAIPFILFKFVNILIHIRFILIFAKFRV